MANSRLTTQTITGVIVVVIGALLFVETIDLYDVGQVWTFVPSLFVLLGLWALVQSDFRNVLGPVIVILVAGGFQLYALDVIPGSSLAALGPLIIIAIGLSILLGQWRRRDAPTSGSDDFDVFGVFSGPQRRITSSSFRGGSITAIFGGATVDLRDVDIADPPAVVTATVLFGGAEIYAPEDWHVQIDALPLFGAVEDERLRTPADQEVNEGPDLIVTGFVAFGGIEVR